MCAFQNFSSMRQKDIGTDNSNFKSATSTSLQISFRYVCYFYDKRVRVPPLRVFCIGLFFFLFAELSQAVVDAGAVPLLVLCIQEPELSLKRISASALSDICKHSPELAQTVVDAGAIAHLAQMILNPDAKLKVSDYKELPLLV